MSAADLLPTSELVRVMTDRCVDRSCEGGDTDAAQADSSEQCRDYYGLFRVDDWCDMCLFNESIKRLAEADAARQQAEQKLAHRKQRAILVREEYDRLIGPLTETARALGYCLGVHGSLARDIDLIAVPWTVEACDPIRLTEVLRVEAERVAGRHVMQLNITEPSPDPFDYTRRGPEPKPHGRGGWSLQIIGTDTYLDLSVFPPLDGENKLRFDVLQDDRDFHRNKHAEFKAEVSDLRAQIARLLQYVRHHPSCTVFGINYPHTWRYGDASLCDCGLSACVPPPQEAAK
jgi:hypothetical protein